MLNEHLLKQIMSTIFDIDSSTINEESSMDNLNNWDSLRHMNLVLALEEEFNVWIPDEDAGNITSFKLIKLVLEDLLQQKSRG
jgi:acyl carrier protein